MTTNLKSLREKYGYTQEYVADYVGVSTKRYGQYERGAHFTTDVLIKLKELYNTSTDYILGLEDTAPLVGDNFIRSETGLGFKSINKLKSLNQEFQTQFLSMRFGINVTGHVYANNLDKMRLVIIDKLLSSNYCDDILKALIQYSFPHDNAIPCIKNKKGKIEILKTDNDCLYMAYDKNRLDDNTQIPLNQIMDKSFYKTKLDILLQEFSNEYNKL